MDEHIHIIISIICFILLLTTLPQSHCQLPPPQQPRFNYSVCKEQFYSCGNLSNIHYPFWDGNSRDRHCGGGDVFQLHCHYLFHLNNTYTTILIGSLNFTVMDIDPERHTMWLMRTDLADDVCSPQFNDTYLSPTLFRYPANVQNITIFYDCSSEDHIDYPICNGSTFHLGAVDAVLKEYPVFTRCLRHVQVPVHDLEPGVEVSDRKGLEGVLNEGFGVGYTVNDDCIRCLGSEGHCWNSTDDDDIEEHVQRSCYYSYCPDGSATTTHCSAPLPPHKISTTIAGRKPNRKRKIILGDSRSNLPLNKKNKP